MSNETSVAVVGAASLALTTDLGGDRTYFKRAPHGSVRSKEEWLGLANLINDHFGLNREYVPVVVTVAATPEPCAACAMRSAYYEIQAESRDESAREEIDTIKEMLMTRGRR